MSRARSRAIRKGLPFDLTESDIEIPTHCPVLGMRLGADRWARPSIDRIVPELGYVRGNIRIISFRANTLRSNASVAELEAILADARALESHPARSMNPGRPAQKPVTKKVLAEQALRVRREEQKKDQKERRANSRKWKMENTWHGQFRTKRLTGDK